MKANIRRIANRIVLILSLLSILGIVLSIIGFRLSVREVQVKQLQTTLRTKAKDELAETNRLINEMVSDLEETAKEISEYDDFWHPNVKEILRISTAMSYSDYTGVTDTQGQGYDNSGNAVNIADRSYFQTAMKGQVAFSEVMESGMFPGEYVQIIAHPIRSEDNAVRGIVYGVFDINRLGDVLLDRNQAHKSGLYIVDSCGAYIGKFQKNSIISSNANFWSDLEKVVLDDLTQQKIKSDFEEKKEGEFSYVYEGETYYACHMPIGPNKWQLIYSVSDATADQIIQSLYKLDADSTISATVGYSLLLMCALWYFKQTNDKVRKAHHEAKKNVEYMNMAMEYSKNTVFEYDQEDREIRLKTDSRTELFYGEVMKDVPECFVSRNLIASDSIPTLKKLFETIAVEHDCEEDIQLIGDNEKIWYRISMHNVYDEQGKIIDTVGIVVDISEQKKREDEMKGKLEMQDALIANALVYAKVDLRTGTLLELNGKESKIDFRDFIRQRVKERVRAEHIAYVEEKLSFESLNEAYRQGKEALEVQFLLKDGDKYKWVSCIAYRICLENGFAAIFVVTDIDKQKRREIALQERAEHDGLTGLYNAATTRAKIDEILSHADSLEENHVFLLLDLDNYKRVNDTFGHGYGDQVLVDIAKTLNTRFRSSDIVGRLGGDEFIVFLRSIKSYDYAQYLMEELCQSVHRTYREGDQEVEISASIGVAIAPDDGNTFEALYKKADIAQYQVKKQGKNGFRKYH